MKCPMVSHNHSNCTNKEACFADPTGIVHDSVVSAECQNEAVEGSKYCQFHIDQMERLGINHDVSRN